MAIWTIVCGLKIDKKVASVLNFVAAKANARNPEFGFDASRDMISRIFLSLGKLPDFLDATRIDFASFFIAALQRAI